MGVEKCGKALGSVLYLTECLPRNHVTCDYSLSYNACFSEKMFPVPEYI